MLDLFDSDQANILDALESNTPNILGVNLKGTAANDNLRGTANFDNIEGLAGDDTLQGLAGDDRLLGNAGNDRLNGGAGDDLMLGGSGNDVYIVAQPKDQVTEKPQEGRDTVLSYINHNLSANVENLILLGKENLQGVGNNLGNRIRGNSGNNQLSGGQGRDLLIGNAGNDRLNGGAGDDLLNGGADDDIFFLAPKQGKDTILDFQEGIDLIELDKEIGFNDLGIAALNETDVLLTINKPDAEYDGQALAIVKNVDINAIAKDDFIYVDSNIGNDKLAKVVEGLSSLEKIFVTLQNSFNNNPLLAENIPLLSQKIDSHNPEIFFNDLKQKIRDLKNNLSNNFTISS